MNLLTSCVLSVGENIGSNRKIEIENDMWMKLSFLFVK